MATKFNSAAFCVTASHWWDSLWGGGHTPETSPPNQGWRAYQAGGDPDTVLVGRKGQPGCFSAQPYGDDHRVDVAFYDETPEQVIDAWKKDEGPDAGYKQFVLVPGWALQALEELRRGKYGEA